MRFSLLNFLGLAFLLLQLASCDENNKGTVLESGNGSGKCNDSSFSLAAPLNNGGSESGEMLYREFPGGCKEFIVRVEGFAPQTYDVTVLDQVVGQLTVGADGRDTLVYDTDNGTFPPDFPALEVGDMGDVAKIVSGTFEESCPVVPEVCGRVESDEGGEGDEGNEGLKFLLSVELRNIAGGSEGVEVHIFNSDSAYSRADAPYNNGNFGRQFRPRGGPNLREFFVEAGQIVTIIAFEAKGFTGDAWQRDLDSLRSPFNVYFIGWEGDDGEFPEPGVLVYTMDSDKSAIAIFDEMPLLTWGKTNESDPSITNGCFDITVEAAPYLNFPNAQPLSNITATGAVCATNGPVALFGQLKPGSIVTVTAQDIGRTLQFFNRWEGGGCGGDRTCRTQVTEQDFSTMAIWRTQ